MRKTLLLITSVIFACVTYYGFFSLDAYAQDNSNLACEFNSDLVGLDITTCIPATEFDNDYVNQLSEVARQNIYSEFYSSYSPSDRTWDFACIKDKYKDVVTSSNKVIFLKDKDGADISTGYCTSGYVDNPPAACCPNAKPELHTTPLTDFFNASNRSTTIPNNTDSYNMPICCPSGTPANFTASQFFTAGCVDTIEYSTNSNKDIIGYNMNGYIRLDEEEFHEFISGANTVNPYSCPSSSNASCVVMAGEAYVEYIDPDGATLLTYSYSVSPEEYSELLLEELPSSVCLACIKEGELYRTELEDGSKTDFICSADGSLTLVSKAGGNKGQYGTESCEPTDQSCINCVGKGGIWIAIGCVDPTPVGIMTRLVQTGIGVMGGVALLQIMYAGLMYQTGNKEKIAKARSQIDATLIGLAVLVFSILILEVIGVNILDVTSAGFF